MYCLKIHYGRGCVQLLCNSYLHSYLPKSISHTIISVTRFKQIQTQATVIYTNGQTTTDHKLDNS